MERFLNKVINGDCLELMKDIPDKSIDMILCDLPYGWGTTVCKWDTVIPFEPLWAEYERIIKPNGAIALFGNEPFSSHLRISNMKIYKYDWVWVKNTATGIAQSKYMPMKYSENISMFYKSLPVYNPIKIERTEGSKKRVRYPLINGGNGEHIKLERIKKQYDSNLKNPSNVIYFNTDPNSKGKLHPTQKPVSLFEYLIKTYTNENEIVLDNCAGSFTTAVACDNTNRNWICMEKEIKYCEIGLKRINENRKKLELNFVDLKK